MEVKICPQCEEHNHVAARSCKKCDHDLRSVAITKLPAVATRNRTDDPVDEKKDKQTTKEETLLPVFVSRFLVGFFGWFLCITLFLVGVFVIMENMGPSGIILVPFTFVPILAIIFAFLIPIVRARRVPVRKNGMAFGIITAYVINFLINLILNMRSDPLAIVGSILGWPFYMIWLENLFGS